MSDTVSLAECVSGSLAGSVALITGSLGKALAVLSFDKDYRKVRDASLNIKQSVSVLNYSSSFFFILAY